MPTTNRKISECTELAVAPASNDLWVVVDVDDTTDSASGTTKKIQTTNTGFLTSSAIGVTVQAWDADLDAWAGKTAPSGTVVGTTDTQTLTNKAVDIAINAQTGTTYTLVLTDTGKLVTLSNAAAITMTVPPNVDVAFSVGTVVALEQIGAGQVTVAAGAGVTIQSKGGLTKINGQFAGASLHKQATNTWWLVGNLA